MGIHYGSLRNLTAREPIAALVRDGFLPRASSGGHRRYQHEDGRRVTVTFHKPSGTFPPKTLKTIIERQARWTEDDLKRLRLLP